MAALVLPRRLRQQPLLGAPLDRSNPLTRGLVSAVVASESPTFYDAALGCFWTDPFTGGSFSGTGVDGFGRWRGFAGAGAYRQTIGIDAPPFFSYPATNRWTALVFVRPNIVTAGRLAIATYGDLSGWNTAVISLGNGVDGRFCGYLLDATAGKVSADSTYTVGNLYAVAYTSNTEAGAQRLFINGVKQAASAGSITTAGKSFANGSLGPSGVDDPYKLYAAFFFNRILSDAEIAALSVNPWQLYAAPDQIVSAASAVTLVEPSLIKSLWREPARPLAQQPQQIAKPNAAWRPAHAWTMLGNGYADHAGGMHAFEKRASVSAKVTKLGWAGVGNGNIGADSGYVSGAGFGQAISGKTELTWFGVVTLDALSGNECVVMRADIDGGASGLMALSVFPTAGSFVIRPLLTTGGTNGWTGSVDNTAAAVAAGGTYLVIARYRSGDALQSAVIPLGSANVQWGGSYAVSGGINLGGTTTFKMHIGGSANTNAAAFPGPVHLAGILPYYASDAQVKALAQNPWQVLAAPTRNISAGVLPTTPVRYVRNTVSGSDANQYSHWTEIAVRTANGTNVAQGKSVTLSSPNSSGYPNSSVVDGSFNTANGYLDLSGTNAWVKVDLGAVYDIANIEILHYPGRTYNNNKTEVSTDGVTWTTVYDSSVSGGYVEPTGKGKVFSAPYNAVAAPPSNTLTAAPAAVTATGIATGLRAARRLTATVAAMTTTGVNAGLAVTSTVNKCLQLAPAVSGQAAVMSGVIAGADCSFAGSYRVVQQTNPTPQSYHTALVSWHFVENDPFPQYKLTIAATYIQLEKSGTIVADNYSISAPIGAQHSFSVVQSSGVITVSLDGSQVLSYTDASPLSDGRIRLASLDARVTFDDLTGALVDNFNSYSATTYGVGATFGGWTVYSDGNGGTVSITQAATMRTLAASTATVAATAVAANLSAQRRIAASVNATAATAIAAGLRTARRLPAAPGAAAATAIAANLRAGRRLPAVVNATTLTALAANLRAGRRMGAVVAAMNVAGVAAGLRCSRRLALSVAAMLASGTATALSVTGQSQLVASTASLLVGAGTTGLRAGRRVTANQASIAVTPRTAALLRKRLFAAQVAQWAVGAGTAQLLVPTSHVLVADKAPVVITSGSITLAAQAHVAIPPALPSSGGPDAPRRSPTHSARYLDTMEVRREFEQMVARRESYRKPEPKPAPVVVPPPPPPPAGSLLDAAPRPELALLARLQEQARQRRNAALLARISGEAPPVRHPPAVAALLKRLG